MPPRATPLDYHLEELAIAQDRHEPRRLMPELHGARRVLDLGCGAGQSLIALGPGPLACGVDVDREALALGAKLTGDVRFVAAAGEALPFPAGSFDLVFSRVAMPYMHVPTAVREARRVLAPGGRLWLALHTPEQWRRDFRRAGWKRRTVLAAVFAASLCFHAGGRLPRVRGAYESFQTRGRMQRLLASSGFGDIRTTHDGPRLVVEARAMATGRG